ncbi:MAG: hypothetical protein HOE48_08005 [Candidatus Latescibacteria bacterium]|nr:hypothetical protein [Candidatus Latescibacterota bacterium]MBT4137842.1 hypothetical protein [Candidatus Latescibacterota bacterium]MBT5831511.1 hypothetical protein [Candidatus Latescibacterota bacterium]
MKIYLSFMLVLLGFTPVLAQSIVPSKQDLHRWLQSQGSTTATGTSTAFNPAIGVNGLFLGFRTSSPLVRETAFGEEHGHEEEDDHADEGADHDDEGDVHTDEEDAHAHGLPEESGLSVQEVEVRFTAVVDAYFRADVILAIPGTEHIELEEGFIETTSLPNVTFRAGKFFGALGKHNTLHSHAYPFIDPPIANERIFGGEGLNEVGLGASMLLPTAWYSEFHAQIFNGDNALFNSAGENDFAYLGRWENLWDVSDNATLAWGGSYVFGKNEHREMTQVWGSDVTFKWRPAKRVRDRGLVLQAEYMQARVNDGLDVEKVGGLYALMQYQFARRWWAQARYDVFGMPRLEPEREYRVSGLLAFAPSEFSAIRVQYNLNREMKQNIHQFAVQLNFTMGAHPAHAY